MNHSDKSDACSVTFPATMDLQETKIFIHIYIFCVSVGILVTINIDIECLCKTMQTGTNNMHLRLKVSLILIATTLQNHTYVGDNTNSAKMFLTGLENRTEPLII